MIRRISVGQVLMLIIMFIVIPSRSVFAENNVSKSHEVVFENKNIKENSVKDNNLKNQNTVVDLNFVYDNTDLVLSIDSVEKHIGRAPRYNAKKGEYKIVFNDVNSKQLHSLFFDVPTHIDPPPYIDYRNISEKVPDFIPKVNFTISLDLPKEVSEIAVYGPKGLIGKYNPTNISFIDQSGEYKTIKGDEFVTIPSAPRNTTLGNTNAVNSPNLVQTATTANTLDITFIGDDYTSLDLTRYHSDINNAIAQVLSIEPYHSRASQIVFHYIDNTSDLGCYYSGRLIMCNNSTITKKVNATGVSYDKIAVLMNHPDLYGGAGATTSTDPIFTSYNGTLGPLVFAHEGFGHTVAQLVDEYILSMNEYAMVNCSTTNPNTSWSGLVAPQDYAQGCDYPNYYRASFDSLMNHLQAPYFNVVSQKAINEKMNYFSSAYADSVLPTTSMLSPTDASTVSNYVNITTDTNDNAGVARAELWVDGVLYHTEYLAPFSFGWPSILYDNGIHSLQVKAYDVANNMATSQIIQVDVQNVPDTIAPVVSISYPTTDSTVPDVLNVLANMSDDSGVIKKTELWKDGVLFATSNQINQNSFRWYSIDDTNGVHTLTIKAYDYSGNVGVSDPVSVIVNNALPIVNITSPSGLTIPRSGSFTISANASTNQYGSISSIELWLDNSKKKTCANVYSCSVSVSTSGVVNGTHTITAKAWDGALPVGNLGISSKTVTK